MIVTLAGHVDHGKTSLVRALTGVNTDRLSEEKRRGLTIDLGFAYRDGLGFVDVPGHHKFIHNMIAGVAERQYALMVIAADDGPMPQTVEHLQILELLGVSRGVIALTKVDMANAEQKQDALVRIKQLTNNTFLESAPVIGCSATNGTGIEALQQNLLQASTENLFTTTGGGFRLAIDRRFNVKGAGLVVTGTVQAGTARIEDELLISEANKLVRIRGIHANQTSAETAVPGDRAALNITGVNHDEVNRGNWLVCPTLYAPVSQVIVRLRMLTTARIIKHWTPVHVYCGTSHRLARLATLEGTELSPGDQALVELVFDEVIDCKFGDRLIVRDQALHITLGGGPVVYQDLYQGSRRNPIRLAKVKSHLHTPVETILQKRLAIEPVELPAFQKLMNLSVDDLNRLVADQAVVTANMAVAFSSWEKWKQEIETTLNKTHQQQPAMEGLKLSALQELLTIPAQFMSPLLAELRKANVLKEINGYWRCVNHNSGLSPESESLYKKLQGPLAAPKPETVGDIAKTFDMSITQLTKELKVLTRADRVIQISDNRFFLQDHLASLQVLAKSLATFTVADFRNHSELGRNAAIQVLEYFDGAGITRRKENIRNYIGD